MDLPSVLKTAGEAFAEIAKENPAIGGIVIVAIVAMASISGLNQYR